MFLALLFLCTAVLVGGSAPAPGLTTIAVYQRTRPPPTPGQHPTQELRHNAQAYGAVLAAAHARDATVRLLVFPELGLGFSCDSRDAAAAYGIEVPVGLTPLPAHAPGVNPCFNASFPASSAVKALSCAVANQPGSTDVVVGAVEVDLSACPPGAANVTACRRQYDVAVYVGADGSIRGKHRKAHLWSTFGCLDGAAPARTVVPTTWGGAVGLLVCFEAMFEASVRDALDGGANIVALPTEWVNTFPVSSATAFQVGWSWQYPDVVLAAANVGSPYSGGSGVYLGGAAAGMEFNASAAVDNALVVGRVPLRAAAGSNPRGGALAAARVDALGDAQGGYTSPCGPPPYNTPASNCTAPVAAVEGSTVHLVASSPNGLLCTADVVVSEAYGSPPSFVLFAVWETLSGCDIQYCSLMRCAGAACTQPGLGPAPAGATHANVTLRSFAPGRRQVFPAVLAVNGTSLPLDPAWTVAVDGAGGDATMAGGVDLSAVLSVTIESVVSTLNGVQN